MRDEGLAAPSEKFPMISRSTELFYRIMRCAPALSQFLSPGPGGALRITHTHHTTHTYVNGSVEVCDSSGMVPNGDANIS